MRYFFASDVHIGLDIEGHSAVRREQIFIKWLSEVEKELTPDNNNSKKGALFLVGDIFDFWLEYKSVVPKQYIRVVSKLAEMSSEGIEIHFFKGNHDTWTLGFFEKELGIIVHDNIFRTTLCGKNIVMAHGHGVNIKDSKLSYKILYTIFNSKIVYKIYRTLVHPDLSSWFGNLWSSSSRKSKNISHEFNYENEPAVKFAKEELERNPDIDYFIMGHLHTPVSYALSDKATFFILNEWISNPGYGVLDENGFSTHLIGYHSK